MGILDKFRRLFGRAPLDPVPDNPDGHAAGHRHLPPPPEQQPPHEAPKDPGHDQPWVRTTHSDSQVRRPRG
jgi:hypothetical protein